MPRWSGRLLIITGIVASCGTPANSKAPAAAPAPAPPRVEAAPAPPPAPSTAPLNENEEGIVGGPDDETSFEFDPETDDDSPRDVQLDRIDPVPRAIVRGLAPYLEARRARLAGVGPGGDRMLVLTRLTEATHVHLLLDPAGARRQVTFGREPIEQVSMAPGHPSTIALRTDVGGDEQYQIGVLDLQTRASSVVSLAHSRHGPLRWSPDARHIAFTGNARNGVDMDVYVASQPFSQPPVLLAELAGENVVLGWDRTAARLAVLHFRSKTESGVRLIDTQTGAIDDIVPAVPGVSTSNATFSPTGDALYVVSDRDGDFKQLFELDLPTRTWKRLLGDATWDLEEIAIGKRSIVLNHNEDGTSVLGLLDTGTKKLRNLRGIPRGVLTSLRYAGPGRLAFTLTTPTEPPDAYTYDIATEKLTRWTFSEVGGLRSTSFVEPTLLRVSSFDGLQIPVYYYRPRGTGPFPVLVWMHGGPEDQSRPAFDPVIQYFVAQGVAVVAPNVRGSDGYGKRYLSLDDGLKRHEAVRDVGAVLDWIASSTDLDADRVGIHGASYGGYMVLASLVEYGERIRAGSDVVGISNLVTFLENTGPYRRELRRAEYGDERDPATRRYLSDISPLPQAHRIRSALLVAHGARDPRVPASEAEAIVEAVRSTGADVWYLLAHREGHSFRQRRTRDTLYRVMAAFFHEHLVSPPGDAAIDETGATEAPVQTTSSDG